MSEGMAVRRPRVGSVGFLLPASWWTIDLATEESRRRSVSRLVDQQVGRADDRAGLRADARKQLGDAADQAAAAGGRVMAVSLMQAQGVPITATLTVYRVPGGEVTGIGLVELESIMRVADDGVLEWPGDAEGRRGRGVRAGCGRCDAGLTRVL